MEFFTDVAVEAATIAGKHLLANFRAHRVAIYGENVLSISNRSLSKEITSANDHEADRLIIDLLSQRCPDHNIMTEESDFVEKDSPYTWIIDPLDGSGNFVNHNPFFAVSVCLAYKNQPLTGVIYSPFLEEIIVARKGHGCTINGRTTSVSSTSELNKTYVVSCPGGDPDNKRFAQLGYVLNEKNKDFRKIGSAAIEAYMVATGRVDAFVTLSISPWDVAAGALCVEESGGKVTDFQGKPWNLDKSDLLITNKVIHEKMLGEIQHSGIQMDERQAVLETS